MEELINAAYWALVFEKVVAEGLPLFLDSARLG
jgi:hypothetical protein